MAKRNRAKFERKPKDFYPTPQKATDVLLSHLPESVKFIEPCAGDGQLMNQLEAAGHECMWASDIEPKHDDVQCVDAAELLTTEWLDHGVDMTITNPPYSKDMLLPILRAAVSWPIPSWWLLPWDMLANKYFTPFTPLVPATAPVGRVTWFVRDEGTTHPSTENYGWIKLAPGNNQRFILPRP